MIGKKVVFIWRAQHQEGTIVGQYRDWELYDKKVASGKGGFVILPQRIGIDYFLIQGDTGHLYHIKCKSILGVV